MSELNKKITLADLAETKRQKQKFAAVSCYDYLTAKLISQTDVKMVLVGDSAAQLVLGYDSTLPATMDFMVAITAAVRRGAPNLFLVADMPYLSYQTGIEIAVKNAGRFVVEAGAQMVKIEATTAFLDVVKAICNADIPVMAHIGIRPQSIAISGKLKAEATTAEAATELIHTAEQMIYAGATALLLEGTAAEVAAIITERSTVPVISCGAGKGCDGQILVAPDILGLTQKAAPKFVRQYANLAESYSKAFSDYADSVIKGKFPDEEHSYHMKKGELDRLHKLLKS